MPNKRYEDNSGSGLPGKVKGPKSDGGAAFKEFSNPGGVGDQEAQDVNGGGVKMPQDNAPKLPRAGGTQ